MALYSCMNCGASVKRKPFDVSPTGRIFCSIECFGDAKRLPQQTCRVCGAGGKLAQGLCNKHYKRFRSRGATDKKVRLTPARAFLEDVAVHFDGAECLFWPYARSSGYGRIRIDGKNHNVSRLVCEMANGAPPTNSHQAAHSCGNGHLGCVNPKHLRWATPLENNADRFLHGTVLRGEEAPSAKLTEDQIRTIRSLRGERSQTRIAKDFGISPGYVSCIQSGRTWRHLAASTGGTGNVR